MKKVKLMVFLLFCVSGIVAQGQIQKPVKWSYAAKRLSAKEAMVYFKAVIEPGWHIYSAYQAEGGPVKTGFSFEKASAYRLVGKILEPKPITKHEEAFDMQVGYFERSVVFQQKVSLLADATTVKGSVEFMACTEKECLPPEEVNFSVPVK